MPNHNDNLERLLDLIADYLITSDIPEMEQVVNQSQKYIRDGQLQQGADSGGLLALFQKDIKANQEDLNSLTTINPGEENEGVIPTLQHLADTVDFSTLNVSSSLGGDGGVSIFLVGGGANFPDGGEDITNLLIGDGNPMNVSQFIPLSQQQSNINVEQAEEFLDTNIFELLPDGDERQQRIIAFFQELNALLPPTSPEFDLNDDGKVDRALDGTWSGSVQYSQDNSISYAQDNEDGNIDEQDAFIHRLKNTANDTNSTRTIEDIYNRVLPYLTDILEPSDELEDVRPEYTNQSSGYLQFRNLNQGIIIRNTNQDFIEGLDPSNPTYLNTDGTGGFTITMWVRFLDKVSEGTLFNFGNPLRTDNPFGFTLDTFVINDAENKLIQDTVSSGYDAVTGNDNPNGALFTDTKSERFVRLIVHDNNTNVTYDSHTANPHMSKKNYLPTIDSTGVNKLAIFNNVKIPQNFNEWYFICASYNPEIQELDSFDFDDDSNGAINNPVKMHNFWMNHIEPFNNTSVVNSTYGNRCKVEIISRTDLLRARGFKVD